MKLTNHIAIRYIGITIAVLLISIPVTYFVLRAVMNNSIDENMKFQRQWIEKKLQTNSAENFISFNNNIIIRPGNGSEGTERHYNEDIFIPYDKEMVPYRVMEFNTTVNGNSYFIRFQKSLVENEDILQAIAGLQLLTLLLLFISLFFINSELNKKIWRPFYLTLETLRHLRIDKDIPNDLPKVSITELNSLNKSLNELTHFNREIFKTQKEFTENASHELQTPLAVMQSSLDLLWQTTPLNEEQVTQLQNLTEANTRMSKLNKSLLLLAKIDNHQFADKKEINMDRLTEKILTQHEANFTQRDIRVAKKSTDVSTVFADETLMETLLGNLISNACRHTPEHGNVEIELSDFGFKTGNSGSGASLDKEKLFKRFQRQNPANQSGNGLGLEICKRICDINDFKITYDFSDGMHWFKIDY